MAIINFTESLHKATQRDYVGRVTEHDKAACAEIATQWGADYWDGERHHGYGGYHYDGRWRPIAEAMAEHYNLKAGERLLDIGCGKGYLLYELTQVVPGLDVAGLDVSSYAIAHAKPEVQELITEGGATELPFAEDSFDCVISLGALHNLPNFDLWRALQEMERVGNSARKYVMVESFRNEREKANLLYWQLTCRSFYAPEEWSWFLDRAGYHGDLGFIFFE